MNKAIASILLWALAGLAQPPQSITLPKPATKGGMPLMQALAERKSTREFAPASLPPATLSNLLWAAYGISRPDGRRTCLLYTSDAADDLLCVDLGGRRI